MNTVNQVELTCTHCSSSSMHDATGKLIGLGVTHTVHAQETRTWNLHKNLHRCTRPKWCGLIGRLCLKVTGTRNLHWIELRSIQCKFMVQVCCTNFLQATSFLTL